MSTLSQFFGPELGAISGHYVKKFSQEAASLGIGARLDYNGGVKDVTNSVIMCRDSATPTPSNFTNTNFITFHMCEEVGTFGTGLIISNAVTTFKIDFLKYLERLALYGYSAAQWVKSQDATGSERLETIDDLTFIAGDNFTFEGIQNFSTFANINKFTFGKYTNAFSVSIAITGCALTAQSVENVLVGLAEGSPTSNLGGTWTVNLSGGTSAGLSTLSSAAVAARLALISYGWTVTLNP